MTKAARIARYAVLAVFLCLGAGVALGLPLLNGATLWTGDDEELLLLAGVALAGGLLGMLLAWDALHRCQRGAGLLGAALLGLGSGIALLVALLLPFAEADRWMSPAILAGLALLWPLALGGLWLAAAERRRRGG